jgi:hypothetical protein
MLPMRRNRKPKYCGKYTQTNKKENNKQKNEIGHISNFETKKHHANLERMKMLSKLFSTDICKESIDANFDERAVNSERSEDSDHRTNERR